MSPSSGNSITILDGGMSRELIRLGAPFDQPEWSALSLIEAPHYVSQVHNDFIAGGANVITTNTYALVPFHIGEERFRQQGSELAALAGRLAREAANKAIGRKVLVAGSLPPIFGSYEPDEFDPKRVHEYLDVLIKALDPYVDIWLGETLSLIAEGKAVQAATASTSKPLWVSFTPDDSHVRAANISPCLRSGESVMEVAQWAVSAGGIDALLFNCCRPVVMTSAIRNATAVLDLPRSTGMTAPALGAYANAFVPRGEDYSANADVCGTDDAMTPEAYLEFALEWVQSDASIIGGCCSIGHEHIAQLSAKFSGT